MTDSNPVFKADRPFEQDSREPKECPVGWYFWDETWSFAHGPYDSEDEARAACSRYARLI